jgi:hypothetical protein
MFIYVFCIALVLFGIWEVFSRVKERTGCGCLAVIVTVALVALIFAGAFLV